MARPNRTLFTEAVDEDLDTPVDLCCVRGGGVARLIATLFSRRKRAAEEADSDSDESVEF